MYEVKDVPKILQRSPDTHKGDYGRIFILAGSVGMTGAACLCSMAALRAGAGIVTLDFSQRFDVIAIGPGLSQYMETRGLVLWLLQNLERPIVLDADGINALADNRDIIDKIKKHVILTPHPGEMAHLVGAKSSQDIQSNRIEIAKSFVRGKKNLTLVLKGYRTIVMNEEKFYINTTGNPGMATAGTGDVLTGMIAALLGQNYTPFDAAQLGVYLHGLAGDIAAQEKGEISLIATDVLENLHRAFLTYKENNSA